MEAGKQPPGNWNADTRTITDGKSGRSLELTAGQYKPRMYHSRIANEFGELQSYLTEQELAEMDKLLTMPTAARELTDYQNDPVGFCFDVLGEFYTDDVIRVMESVRDNPVTIAQSANATGKTHGAARIAIWFYKVFPGAQVYTAAAPPEGNLKRLLWGEIGQIVDRHAHLFADDRSTTLNIQRSSLEFVTGVAIPMSGTPAQREAKFSGKHAPHLLFIVDEGDAVPDEVFSGIESCISGGHARLLVMFNPRSEQGAVYRMARDNQANVVTLSAFDHPNVKSGVDQIPGAVSREKTVQRINEWSRPLMDGERKNRECYEVPDFLVGATATSLDGRTQYPPLPAGTRKITNPAFSYMVLGQYPDQSETQLIARQWIYDARSRWDLYVAKHGEMPPAGVRPVMGQDVSEFGQDWNVTFFRWGGFVSRAVAWQGVDPDVTADRAIELFRQNDAEVCNVDGTGVGAGVAPKMSRAGCRSVSLKVASSPTETTPEGEFGILRDQLWWRVREWLRTDPGAMLPPDEQLIEELGKPLYEVRAGKIRVMSKDHMRAMLGRSPDRADALCLTFAPSPPPAAGEVEHINADIYKPQRRRRWE